MKPDLIAAALGQIFRITKTSEGQLAVASVGGLAYAVALGIALPPVAVVSGAAVVVAYIAGRSYQKAYGAKDEGNGNDTPV